MLIVNNNYVFCSCFVFLRYLVELKNLRNIEIPPPYNYTQTEKSLQDLCNTLPMQKIQQVLMKYKLDFHMFGYDPSPCLSANGTKKLNNTQIT